MACRRCQAVDVAGCLCALEDSSCIEVTGSGTADNPFVVELVLNNDPDNIAECANGLLVTIPTSITHPPSCRVYRSTTLAVPTSTIVTVPFSSEVWDSDGMWALADPDKIYAPIDGLYECIGHSVFDNTSEAGLRTVVRHSTGPAVAVSTADSSSGPGQHSRFTPTGWYPFTAGDYITMEVYHDGAATTLNSEGISTGLELHYRRPLV